MRGGIVGIDFENRWLKNSLSQENPSGLEL